MIPCLATALQDVYAPPRTAGRADHRPLVCRGVATSQLSWLINIRFPCMYTGDTKSVECPGSLSRFGLALLGGNLISSLFGRTGRGTRTSTGTATCARTYLGFGILFHRLKDRESWRWALA